jgi:hypothetical protein
MINTNRAMSNCRARFLHKKKRCKNLHIPNHHRAMHERRPKAKQNRHIEVAKAGGAAALGAAAGDGTVTATGLSAAGMTGCRCRFRHGSGSAWGRDRRPYRSCRIWYLASSSKLKSTHAPATSKRCSCFVSSFRDRIGVYWLTAAIIRLLASVQSTWILEEINTFRAPGTR